MAPNLDLTSHRYQIISLIEGNPPLGVENRLPIAAQIVRLNDIDTTWTVRDGGEPSTYRLGVGPYGYTSVNPDELLGTTHAEHDVKWIVVYRDAQDAYTIELVVEEPQTGPVGWTVTDDSDNSTISIKSIIPQPFKILPKYYYPNQLFRFIPED